MQFNAYNLYYMVTVIEPSTYLIFYTTQMLTVN